MASQRSRPHNLAILALVAGSFQKGIDPDTPERERDYLAEDEARVIRAYATAPATAPILLYTLPI